MKERIQLQWQRSLIFTAVVTKLISPVQKFFNYVHTAKLPHKLPTFFRYNEHSLIFVFNFAAELLHQFRSRTSYVCVRKLVFSYFWLYQKRGLRACPIFALGLKQLKRSMVVHKKVFLLTHTATVTILATHIPRTKN